MTMTLNTRWRLRPRRRHVGRKVARAASLNAVGTVSDGGFERAAVAGFSALLIALEGHGPGGWWLWCLHFRVHARPQWE